MSTSKDASTRRSRSSGDRAARHDTDSGEDLHQHVPQLGWRSPADLGADWVSVGGSVSI